jgi:hypothetical protein
MAAMYLNSKYSLNRASTYGRASMLLQLACRWGVCEWGVGDVGGKCSHMQNWPEPESGWINSRVSNLLQ